MVVLTQHRKSGVVGLHVGAGNVQRYFPREVRMVELELDHLRIVCSLEPSFWGDCPEIHDVRLSLWLESKRNSGKIAQCSAPVALIPAGPNTFRLQVTLEEQATVNANVIYSTSLPPMTRVVDPMAKSTSIPVSLPDGLDGFVERRARRRPVVRELGKLKGNDHASERPLATAVH